MKLRGIYILARIWFFIRDKFLTKKFITFGFIGVLNTGIHMTVYSVGYSKLSSLLGPSQIELSAFISNTFAFITASIFSYFANAIFTFKPNKRTYRQFYFVILVFIIRLLISSTLTATFNYIVIDWFNVNYDLAPWAKFIAPFMGSALLIPVAYFALDFVFKKTDIIKKES